MDSIIVRSYAYMIREEFKITVGKQPQDGLIILHKGSFSCSFDRKKTFIARAGDYIFFPLTEKFERHVLEPCSFVLINFTLETKPSSNAVLPCGLVSFRNRDRAKNNAELFFELVNRNDEMGAIMRNHVLNDIYYQIQYETNPDPEAYDMISSPCRKALHYFYDHFTEKLSLQEVADHVGMSVNGLIQRFRWETGHTPMAFLTLRRIRHAKYLLAHTTDSIGSIAEQCGYDNIYYFSTSFKKIEGCTASEYRNNAPRA